MSNKAFSKSENEYVQWLWAWIHFGTSIFHLHEISLLHTDLNKGNVIYSTEGTVVMIDYGGIAKIDFPHDWEKIPTGLMPLFRWTDIDESSAFRFGYIHYGGELARKIFSYYRQKKGFNYFRFSDKYSYEPLQLDDFDKNSQEIEQEYQSWELLRKKMKYGNLLNGSLHIHHFYQWSTQRKDIEFSSEYEELRANEYHYLKHLVSSLVAQDSSEYFNALFNLEGFYYKLQEISKGLGITLLCKKLIKEYHLVLPEKLQEQIDNDENIALEYVTADEIEAIREIIEEPNIFRILWALDDLENGEIKKCITKTICQLGFRCGQQSPQPATTSVGFDRKATRNPQLHIVSAVSGNVKSNCINIDE